MALIIRIKRKLVVDNANRSLDKGNNCGFKNINIHILKVENYVLIGGNF